MKNYFTSIKNVFHCFYIYFDKYLQLLCPQWKDAAFAILSISDDQNTRVFTVQVSQNTRKNRVWQPILKFFNIFEVTEVLSFHSYVLICLIYCDLAIKQQTNVSRSTVQVYFERNCVACSRSQRGRDNFLSQSIWGFCAPLWLSRTGRWAATNTRQSFVSAPCGGQLGSAVSAASCATQSGCRGQ